MKKMLCIGALVCALSAGAYLYRQKQYCETSKQEVASPEPWGMNMCGEALTYLRDGLARMKKVGVEYSQRQVVSMLRCADKEYNPRTEHRLDVEEAKELYEVVLNPDSALGRAAMPPDKIPFTNYTVPMPARYESFLQTLLDTNNDGCISKDEVEKVLKKMRGW